MHSVPGLRDIWGRGPVEGATIVFRRARNEAGCSSIVVRGCGGLVGCGCHCVRTYRGEDVAVQASWCLRITGFHWRWAATSASRVGMRAGSRRPGLYVRMYPCARGENYFGTRTIVTCELLAGCWMLPPLSRCPFGKYCVAGCPSTCGIFGRSCGLVQP